MTGSSPADPEIADPSAQLVRRWLRLYSRGLPAQIKERRQDEIEADLWDESAEAGFVGAPDASLAWQRLVRLATGAPADIAWRLEVGRGFDGEGSHSMIASRRDVLWSLLGVVLSALFVWGGLTMSSAPNWQLARQFGLLVAATGGFGVLASLIILVIPTIGRPLCIAAGVGITLAIVLAMPWAWFVVLPATIPIGFVGARRRRIAPPVPDATHPA